MIKEGSEKKPALLILLIIIIFFNHKNPTFQNLFNVFLKYTLATIIGTPRNSYE